MRVLMVTLELADPVFSGNGVYGRTIVEALVSAGVYVDVLCGAPADDADGPPFASHTALAAAASDSRLRVARVPLPVWEKVDRGAAFSAFAEGAAAAISTLLDGSGEYDLLIGVDWTAAAALDRVRVLLPTSPKVVHMNFRVFFAQLELLDGADDLEFYTEKERVACAQADTVITLTAADAATLAPLLPPTASTAILAPPLRADIAALATRPPLGQAPRRRFITICARISEEKCIAEYVGICCAARDTLNELGACVLVRAIYRYCF